MDEISVIRTLPDYVSVSICEKIEPKEEAEFCPEYVTIWGSTKDFENQYAFGLCKLYNRLVTCSTYPTYLHKCRRNSCVTMMDDSKNKSYQVIS